jgi:hypothetical protein
VRSVSKDPITGLTLAINGKQVLDLRDRALSPGGSLRYVGLSEAAICDATWKELERVPVDAGIARVGPGPQQVKVACAPRVGASLRLELRTLSPAQRLASSRASS